LQNFIRNYPNSPLANYAQDRIDALKRAALQRDEDQRRAAAAEQARLEAARLKAEQEAAAKRDEEQRRAADQAARAAEAERQAQIARQRADEAARNRAAADAEALRRASELQAQQAEQERRRADQAAAQEAVCRREQDRLDQLSAQGSAALDDLRVFARTVTCPRLGGVVVATLEKVNGEARRQASTAPNSIEILRAAQSQLARLGCFEGKIDGSLTTTQDALGRYRVAKGDKASTNAVTQAVVDDLSQQNGRVCPVQCDAGQVAKGDVCVAIAKPTTPPPTASRKPDKDEDKHKPVRQADREPPHPARPQPQAAPHPAAVQQAQARPSYTPSYGGGGGGGGHSTMVGVGF
jgi:hypothetical protein